MSQKSSPKSPRTPRSKSPSCDDGAPGIENMDNIQEAVAEELRSPDRNISQAQQSVRGDPASHISARSRGSYVGTGAQSRVSYHPSATSRPPTAPHSRVPSTYEDEPPRLPSPPHSPVAYGSRAASLGHSQRASRTASPEHWSNHTSYPEIAQDAGGAAEYCEDDGQPPAPESSHYMQASMRGTPAPSHPSMRATPPPSHPSMRGAPSNQYYAPSQASVRAAASSHPSFREGGSPSYRGMPAASRSAALGTVGPSTVTFGNKSDMQYGMAEAEASAMSARSLQGSAGGMAPGSCSKPGMSAMEFAVSGIGLSTSGLTDGGVDAATSAMSYGMPKERPGAGCIPGCRKDIPKAPSSTPYQMNQEPMPSHSMRQPMGAMGPMGPMGAMGAMGPSVQGGMPSGHHMMSHDPGHHGQHAPRTPTPNFDRGPSPPGGHGGPSSADHSHHHHHHDGFEGFPEPDEKVVSALGHLSQFKKTPSYYRCGIGDDMDFLKSCCPKLKESVRAPGKVATFPEIPCLRQDDIDELIKCETADVESAWFLTSDERKTYKKPCPKQQKAQMSVKALVQAHAAQTCAGKEYSPLEHPDPEDISPEVAAAMMFSQEKGIKMEECPNYTITNLFPDEPKTPFPEKIPASSISIVDRNSKDQEEMIEKSATVPSEGVSDSAYTRTMKEKGSEDMGAQKSFDVDFAIGQSKREYVLVAQKPQRVNKVQFRGGNSPPWFPGYLSAFPDEEGLKVVSSPSSLFHKAWVHSNPVNMPTSDVIVLD